jgi:hypothetical protein
VTTADPSVVSLPRDDDGLLRGLAATPRPTGSDAIGAARARVARELESLGFETRELPFDFSAFPGRFATPLFGGAALMLVGIAGHWGSRGQRWIPLLVLVLGGVALLLAGRWIARRGVLVMPLMRERGVNLEAVRPGAAGGARRAQPTVWLCAHLDTKSQPIPTLVRVLGVVLLSLGFAATLLLSIVAAAGTTEPMFWWVAAALVTLAGAVPVVMSVVGTSSPGALDNASGVAAVVEAARGLDASVGVLVTDAEELGLAGARAWAAAAPRDTVVLNCDGVDDDGANTVLLGGRPGAIRDALPAEMERRSFVPGFLTDSVAFADAGLASVTFMRGGWASLARVHSRSDDLAHLRGTGIAPVASLIAATARNLGDR